MRQTSLQKNFEHEKQTMTYEKGQEVNIESLLCPLGTDCVQTKWPLDDLKRWDSRVNTSTQMVQTQRPCRTQRCNHILPDWEVANIRRLTHLVFRKMCSSSGWESCGWASLHHALSLRSNRRDPSRQQVVDRRPEVLNRAALNSFPSAEAKIALYNDKGPKL